MNIFKAYAPISKVDDDQRMVFGYASTDTKDSQGDVVKIDAIEKALPDYMRFANIREMHTMSAVGVAKSAEVDEKGLYIGAKVVDDAAWLKVKEGVYKGFSIGGKALKKSNGIIEELKLTEISLVDRPANPECVIDTWKAEGGDEAGGDDQGTDAGNVEKSEGEPSAAGATDDRFALIRKAAGEVSYEAGKPIWDAGRALSAMDSIFSLMLSEASEKEKEPEQLALLQAAINSLKAFVIAELQEQTENGAAVQMADGASDDVAKAGATYSKATAAKLKEIHDMIQKCDNAMKSMGYDSMGKGDESAPLISEEVAGLAKAAGIEGDNFEVISKAAFEALAKAQARVKELEAQPEPSKAAVTDTPVSKSDDTKDGLASPAGEQPDPTNPLSMFKAVLARPLAMAGTTISQPSSAN